MIIPIIKDKKGLITDQDNYQPIAITLVALKIMVTVILQRLQVYIYATDNQFSYKPKHSTEMCVFTLKSIIDNYVASSSSIYVCYVDTSKALDRLNYWILFESENLLL